jgi:hypothetical protein
MYSSCNYKNLVVYIGRKHESFPFLIIKVVCGLLQVMVCKHRKIIQIRHCAYRCSLTQGEQFTPPALYETSDNGLNWTTIPDPGIGYLSSIGLIDNYISLVQIQVEFL